MYSELLNFRMKKFNFFFKNNYFKTMEEKIKTKSISATI